MLAEMNEGIKSAYERLQVISQDDAKRREYDARMKALRDYNQGMIEAEEKGMERGRTEGRIETIKALLKNMSADQVAAALEMPVTEIHRIESMES